MKNNGFNQANTLLRKGRLHEAIRLYESYAIDHHYYYVYENMGYAYQLLGNVEKAQEHYAVSYQLNSKAIRPNLFFKQNNIVPPACNISSPSAIELIKKASNKIDQSLLKSSYLESQISKYENDFCIARVIGNDLYPRHEIGQSRKNLEFIIKHETNFQNLKKIWIVNRIVDHEEFTKIISILERYSQTYVVIPFDEYEYKNITFDTNILPSDDFIKSRSFSELSIDETSQIFNAMLRNKNNYLMNNNGARNVALHEAKKHAKWVLPWDGNCFLTDNAWLEIVDAVSSTPWFSHFIVPMTRVLDNNHLFDNQYVPNPVEEPQIIFRKDTKEVFNADFYYGRRPKVEMFWHLGVPGKWDEWSDGKWDIKRRPISKDANKFALAGWVARLYSGNAKLELDSSESASERNLTRKFAVIAFIAQIDNKLSIDTHFHHQMYSFLEQNLHEAKLNYKRKPIISTEFYKLQNEIDSAIKLNKNNGYSFAFVISLKSKRISHDWEVVKNNLQRTLNTILSNKCDKLRVVVCGHEYPNIEGMKSDSVTWIQADFPIPKDSSGFPADKMKKRRLILQRLKDINYKGYVVPCDADDWIHKDFCQYISSLDEKDLFVLDAGCLINLLNKEAWIRSKRFFIGCGTSSVVRFDAQNAPDFSDFKSSVEAPYSILFGGHGEVIKKAVTHNLRYENVCLPVVTWVLANGENISIDMGKKSTEISASNYSASSYFLDDGFQDYFIVN